MQANTVIAQLPSNAIARLGVHYPDSHCEFYAGMDGINWGEAAARGVFAKDAGLKTVNFTEPRTAKFLKLMAKSGHANGPWASLAELEIIENQIKNK